MRRLSLTLTAFALVAMLAVSGCGFQLRGSINIPFKTLYIGVNDTSALAVALKRNIRGNGNTQLVADPKDAEGRLEILGESHETELITINNLGQAVEYYIYTKLRFRLVSSTGKEYIPASDISERRLIKVNNNAVLAQQSEVNQLYADMENDAALQILRRIEAIKIEQ